MSSESDQYQLVFEGLESNEPEAVRKLKGLLIGDLQLSIEEVQAAFSTPPAILKTAAEPEQLRQLALRLKELGARTSITDPRTTEELVESMHLDLDAELWEVVDTGGREPIEEEAANEIELDFDLLATDPAPLGAPPVQAPTAVSSTSAERPAKVYELTFDEEESAASAPASASESSEPAAEKAIAPATNELSLTIDTEESAATPEEDPDLGAAASSLLASVEAELSIPKEEPQKDEPPTFDLTIHPDPLDPIEGSVPMKSAAPARSASTPDKKVAENADASSLPVQELNVSDFGMGELLDADELIASVEQVKSDSAVTEVTKSTHISTPAPPPPATGALELTLELEDAPTPAPPPVPERSPGGTQAPFVELSKNEEAPGATVSAEMHESTAEESLADTATRAPMSLSEMARRTPTETSEAPTPAAEPATSPTPPRMAPLTHAASKLTPMQKNVGIPAFIGVLLLGVVNWHIAGQRAELDPSATVSSSLKQIAAPPKPAAKPANEPPAPPPQPTQRFSQRIDRGTHAWELVVNTSDDKVLDASLQLTTPEPPPLSPEQIVRKEIRIPWLVRAEANQIEFTPAENGSMNALGVLRAYVDYSGTRDRVTLPFTLNVRFRKEAKELDFDIDVREKVGTDAPSLVAVALDSGGGYKVRYRDGATLTNPTALEKDEKEPGS